MLLIHSIYGLVQSARQYYIKFKEKLINVGFSGGFPDPCLMMRETENGVVYIAVWVDDLLLIGDGEAIEEAVKDLEEQLMQALADSDALQKLVYEKEKNIHHTPVMTIQPSLYPSAPPSPCDA